MKNLLARLRRVDNSRLIAMFGQARLVATAGGQIELRGGTRADQAEAREWISLFMHEAAPRIVPAESAECAG